MIRGIFEVRVSTSKPNYKEGTEVHVSSPLLRYIKERKRKKHNSLGARMVRVSSLKLIRSIL